jgi:hypothetical protein
MPEVEAHEVARAIARVLLELTDPAEVVIS